MGDLIAFKPKRRAIRPRAASDEQGTVVIFTGVRRECAENLEIAPVKARKTRRIRKVSESYPGKCKGKAGAGKQL